MNQASGRTGTLHRVLEFLGLKLPVLFLLAAVVLIGLGEKLWERFLPKYLESLGGTALLIGAFGAAQNAVNALWSLPGGYLSDWLGYRKALMGFTLLAMAGYLIAMLIHHWSAVFGGMILFTAWPALALPAIMSLFGTLLTREQRAMGISMHSIVRRIPMALGPVLGGILIGRIGIQEGVRVAMGCSFFLGIAALAMLARIPMETASPYEPLHALALWRRMDHRLRHLLLSDILIRFCEQIPNVFVVLWCLNVARATPEQFGILTAIEMGTAMLLYIPVAHFSDRRAHQHSTERKPFILFTFVFFTCFPAVLYYSRTFSFLAVAFVVRGLKEFGEPTRKALIVDLADPEAKGRTVGLYYLIRDLVVSAGAFMGGWLWSIGPAWNLWTAFAFGIMATAIFAAWGRGSEGASVARPAESPGGDPE